MDEISNQQHIELPIIKKQCLRQQIAKKQKKRSKKRPKKRRSVLPKPSKIPSSPNNNNINNKSMTYNLERGWLESLKPKHKLYVYDKDINSWKIGTILQKKEIYSKQSKQYKYKLKISVQTDDLKYMIWIIINQYATKSDKIRKYKTYHRVVQSHKVYHANQSGYCYKNTFLSKRCCGCNRMCCPCYFIEIHFKEYACFDCSNKVQKNSISKGIINSNLFNKHQDIITIIISYSSGFLAFCKECDTTKYCGLDAREYYNYMRYSMNCSQCKQMICYKCRKSFYVNKWCDDKVSCTKCAESHALNIHFKCLQQILGEIEWISKLINSDNDREIVKRISEYSVGYIVECTNFEKCQYKFFIHSENSLERLVYNANAYKIKKEYLSTTNRSKTYIFGKHARMTCINCRQNVIDSARCRIRFCYKIDYKYNECLNHPTCQLCKKRVATTIKCKHCEIRFCDECGLTDKDSRDSHYYRYYKNKRNKNGICKSCIKSQEMDKINNAIIESLATFDVNLAKIIGQYAYGMIVECMTTKCLNNILINNKYEFLKNLKIKYYTPKVRKMNTILIFGKKIRIFCSQCVEKKIVTECKAKYCKFGNYDQYMICGDHKICKICKIKQIHPKERKNKKCTICNILCCRNCYEKNDSQCIKCVNKKILYELLKNYIDDKQIIDILSEYTHYIHHINIYNIKKATQRKPPIIKVVNIKRYSKQYCQYPMDEYSDIEINEHLMDYDYIQQFYARI